MYSETINSLHMLNPITYLGYVKREDILINVEKSNVAGKKVYDEDKFAELEKVIKRSLIMGKKTLIYFPTVALIKRCMSRMVTEKLSSNIAVYYGKIQKMQPMTISEMEIS